MSKKQISDPHTRTKTHHSKWAKQQITFFFREFFSTSAAAAVTYDHHYYSLYIVICCCCRGSGTVFTLNIEWWLVSHCCVIDTDECYCIDMCVCVCIWFYRISVCERHRSHPTDYYIIIVIYIATIIVIIILSHENE